MIHIPLQQSIIDYSIKFSESTNLGNRIRNNGSKTEQLVGIISENTVRNYLGLDLMKPNSGWDGGFDITYNSLKLDIKSMRRKRQPLPYYVNNIFDDQRNHNCDGYIFTSLNTESKTLTICGWISKDEFYKKATLYKKGSLRKRGNDVFNLRANNWEIENDKLNMFIK